MYIHEYLVPTEARKGIEFPTQRFACLFLMLLAGIKGGYHHTWLHLSFKEYNIIMNIQLLC